MSDSFNPIEILARIRAKAAENSVEQSFEPVDNILKSNLTTFYVITKIDPRPPGSPGP